MPVENQLDETTVPGVPVCFNGMSCGAGSSAGSRRAAQKPFRTQILVDVRPVNTEAAGAELPVRPLIGCGMEETRKPGERNADGAPVSQIGGERVLVESDVEDAFTRVGVGSSHSRLAVVRLGYR